MHFFDKDKIPVKVLRDRDEWEVRRKGGAGSAHTDLINYGTVYVFKF